MCQDDTTKRKIGGGAMTSHIIATTRRVGAGSARRYQVDTWKVALCP
jgi:hypothetical protein